MSGRTISEKIIDEHTVDNDADTMYRRVRIDALLGHDATIALLVDEFERRGLKSGIRSAFYSQTIISLRLLRRSARTFRINSCALRARRKFVTS